MKEIRLRMCNAKPSKKVTRQVNGILLLDKPYGLSSNKALQIVKRLFCAARAGHTGSLDPLATGMLPVCFGHATKLSAFMLDADKSYCVSAKLGQKTDTGDAEGDVIDTRPILQISSADFRGVLDGFLGETEQIPPMYSALKCDGKRLYELARKGIAVERKPRKIFLRHIELLEWNETGFTLNVSCSKGTYIRTLVEDIAERIGTVAHVSQLRRTGLANFSQDAMVTLDDLRELAEQNQNLDSTLLPVDYPIQHLPYIELDEHSAFYLKRGQPVQVAYAPDASQIRLYEAESRKFIGIGEMQMNGLVAPKRLFIG
jgi:tRNA pseudouridine55 synthase